MLKKILIAAAILVAAFVAVVVLQPDRLEVRRSGFVAAPPDVVFGLLDDFVAWQQWNPWHHLDPDQQTTLSGASSGVGAKYAWKGNGDVGEGSMEITSAEPPNRVGMALHFEAPWQADNDVTFEIVPEAGGSRVTWTMSGRKDFGSKVAGLFLDMDGMIGADFERGLRNLDDVAKAEAGRRTAATSAPPIDGTPSPEPSAATP